MPAGNFDWRPFLTAVSTLAPHLAQQRVQEKQSAAIARGQSDAAGRQREADQRVSDEVAALRASSPEEESRAALADYTMALAQMRSRGNASEATNLSDKATAGREAAEAGSRQYGRGQAEFMSAIRGPVRQRELETQRMTRAGTDIEGLGRGARMDEFLAQLRARQQQVDPWVLLLSRIGQAIGQNYQAEGEDVEDPYGGSATTYPLPQQRGPTSVQPLQFSPPVRR